MPESGPATEADVIAHELYTMRKMVEQLPHGVGTLLLNQLDRIVDAYIARDKSLVAKLSVSIDDAMLAVKLQEFDLECTRRERAELQQRLEDGS